MRRFSALVFSVCCACGGSTDQDTPHSGGAGGSATGGFGGSSKGGSGGSAACGNYAPLASAAELAKTPRANADSELLALEASPTDLVAPDALYARVLAELSQIFIVDPSVSAIRVFSPELTGSLIVTFDDAGFANYKAGNYHAWDCPNQAYAAVDKGGLDFAKSTQLAFGDKRLNMPLLAKEYAALANVAQADPNSMGGDASDVCLEIQGDRHYFIFDAAGGDCPAGCTEHFYSAFQADPGPNVTALGNYNPVDPSLPPGWWNDLADCRTRL